MKKNRLKFIAATALILFNLLTCFAGTYAWFIASLSNSASSMQVQMYTYELDMSYKVYKYDDNTKSGIDATDLNDALVLPQYDSVITSRNVNTGIVLEFLVSGIALGENLPITITTHCLSDNISSRCVSNIVELKFAVINSISSADANIIYQDCLDYFAEEEGITFINNNIKTQEIEYNISNYENYLSGGSLRLFVLIDYSPILISNFEFIFDEIESTRFSNDLTLINCSTSQE